MKLKEDSNRHLYKSVRHRDNPSSACKSFVISRIHRTCSDTGVDLLSQSELILEHAFAPAACAQESQKFRGDYQCNDYYLYLFPSIPTGLRSIKVKQHGIVSFSARRFVSQYKMPATLA